MRITAAATFSLLSLSTLVPSVVGKQVFVELLPNGDNVDGVKAIGHKEKDGGGVLNDFGDAFDTAGRSWSMELCMADSDGDGQTNGEELGDPCCEWTKESGDAPLWTSGVSNPGDDTSTSDTTKWPAYECSSMASSTSSSQDSDVGDEDSASASASTSDSGSTTSISGSSTVAASAAVVFVALFVALVA